MERLSRPAGGDPLIALGDRLRRLTPSMLLIAVAAACWAVTADRMQGMNMGPGTDLGELGWFAGVWVTMMAARMLPSLVPMAQTFAGASRRSGASMPTATASVFTFGYLLTWAAAGVRSSRSRSCFPGTRLRPGRSRC